MALTTTSKVNPYYVQQMEKQLGSLGNRTSIPTTQASVLSHVGEPTSMARFSNGDYMYASPQQVQNAQSQAQAQATQKAASTIDGIIGKQNTGSGSPYVGTDANNTQSATKPSLDELMYGSGVVRNLSSANVTLPTSSSDTDVNLNLSGAGGNGGLGGGYANVNYGGDYANQLSQMLLAYQNQQKEQLAAQQAAQAEQVRNAYLNNMNALDNAYNGQLGNLETIYNNTMEQMGNNYNYSADQIAQKADQALREAYINRMLSQKNLAQQLNANGLTGGAAESTIAGLLNNYGNSRNNIETARMNDLASLLNTYQNNVANAQESYSNAKSDAEKARMQYYMQLQNDLANGVLGTYDNMYGALASGSNTYANAMQNLASNMVNNAADLAATNYKNLINAAYKGSASSSADSSAYQNAVNQMVAGGAGKDEVYNYLIQNDVPSSTILSIMRAAGLTS